MAFLPQKCNFPAYQLIYPDRCNGVDDLLLSFSEIRWLRRGSFN